VLQRCSLCPAVHRLADGREDSIHRANRREVDATTEKPGLVKHVENGSSLLVGQPSGARRRLARPRHRRRLARSIESRSTHAERIARGLERHRVVIALLDERHELSSSSSTLDSSNVGSAMPRMACAFFWSSMSPFAMRSLRPGLCGSSAAAPRLPSCSRDDRHLAPVSRRGVLVPDGTGAVIQRTNRRRKTRFVAAPSSCERTHPGAQWHCGRSARVVRMASSMGFTGPRRYGGDFSREIECGSARGLSSGHASATSPSGVASGTRHCCWRSGRRTSGSRCVGRAGRRGRGASRRGPR
jgi:hypothetical protein